MVYQSGFSGSLIQGFLAETTRVATRATIYRSLRALQAQNRKKVSKRVFWGVCKKSPKIPETVKNYPQKVHFRVFLTFSDIFGDFFADPQKDSFFFFVETFPRFLAERAPRLL